MKKEIKSFRAAFKGLFHLWFNERHGRFHLAASLLALTGGWLLDISKNDWLAVLLCIGLVNGLEALNSALEQTLDQLHPELHPAVGRAKDLAAGAVLIAALCSAAIGLFVYGPPLLEIIGL